MEQIINRHAEALAAELRKAKKEKKWRGDGKGNLIENRAVNDSIQNYCFINGQAIMAEAGLSYCNKCDIPALQKLYKDITDRALNLAKARLWKAA